MRRNPFLDFQITAERAGYPALLIVSLLCLALVVVPVALLALTEALWVLAVALLSLIGAVAILSAGIGAAFADRGEPDVEPPKAVPATDERRQEKTNGAVSTRDSAARVRSSHSPLVVVPRGSDAVPLDVQGSTSPRRIA